MRMTAETIAWVFLSYSGSCGASMGYIQAYAVLGRSGKQSRSSDAEGVARAPRMHSESRVITLISTAMFQQPCAAHRSLKAVCNVYVKSFIADPRAEFILGQMPRKLMRYLCKPGLCAGGHFMTCPTCTLCSLCAVLVIPTMNFGQL